MGAVAFRALAGRLPFEGTNAGMIIALKLDRPAPSLSDVTGDRWPAGLERFLAVVLQREPEGRFATATEALDEWRRVLPIALTRRSTPPPLRARAAVPSHTDTAIDGPPTMTEATGGPQWDTASSETEVGDGFDGPD
jgi:serine/threonine-protein kinase